MSLKLLEGNLSTFIKGKENLYVYNICIANIMKKEIRLQNLLLKHYSVYLINLRGCGKSDQASSDEAYSMSGTVKDLEAIREALWLEKWHLQDILQEGC